MVVPFMPVHTTASAFLMVMPLTADTAMALMGFTASTGIVPAITATVRAITATDIVHVITAGAGKATVGPAMAGRAVVGKGAAGVDKVREVRLGEEEAEVAGEDGVRIEA
jgi:hypothetical protein